MKLFYRSSGQGPPLIVLHGLFGSSDNWYTLAKTFSQTHTVYLLDQRNHGQSPHSDGFNYELLTSDLLEFMQDQNLGEADIIGHSMGGKTAMNFAVQHPEKVKKLVVVDIVPKSYVMRHDSILQGMKALALETLQSRSDAEAMLTPYVPNVAERQFIMKNLERKEGGGFSWKVNLKALDEHMEDLGKGMVFPGTFTKPALFVRGARSAYYENGDEEAIRKIFTAVQFISLDTGHWVQAEQPKEFADAVLAFLNQ